ncbi:MAG TPA: hypothetical protein PLA27_05150 [Anaerolineales bacterium]|jgi:hypothetical protein|nr:hypothetical protein [Anaerolineales bacterium]HQX15788.1 hypothetical protein [Anaerolineales bacterium]
MEPQPYIPGTKPADAGPLARFMPPLEEGVIARWLPLHSSTGSWLLDPFGFSPRLALEAARAGYRVLVTVNNPITRFLLEIAANPPSESDFNAALAELETAKKGDERLGAHLKSLYQTSCEKCNSEVQAEYFLWRKEADAPHARVYTCPQCNDSGERAVNKQDIERAKKIAATDGLHRSRAFERVAKLDDDDRVYAEEAIQHYLPRPLYFLTTVINRVDGLNLTPERKRALNALILVACDAGNTLWDHPATRPRPKQLNIPSQFREHNLWTQLERGLSLWTETGSPVAIEAWPRKIPESGGVCIYEGRLKELAHEVKKEIPIAAVIGSLPRPNQAFWTLSALWAGWLWGREAVEPYKVALRRRRYDWAWNATALHAAFSHLFELLPLGTPLFGFVPEPEPPFLTSALTAASAAGFDLKSVALRTEHDPIQILWNRGEHLKREANEPNVSVVREAIHSHLIERGEPASFLHVHAAALIALAEAHALKNKTQEFDEALRATNALIQSALSEDERFVHYSSGESVDTGLWSADFSPLAKRGADFSPHSESLADRVEVAIVTFLQKNPNSIYLEIEDDLYPQFTGLLTPSKAMIYAVLDSYAQRDGASLKLRAEDVALARRNERDTIIPMLELVGKRLGYSTSLADKNHVWEENNSVQFAFYVLASALVGRAMDDTPYSPEQTILVIPGGRASLIAYKASRDPALAARLKKYRLVKYRLLRTMLEVPVLTRETFEEQIASDPLEKSKSQMMMF